MLFNKTFLLFSFLLISFQSGFSQSDDYKEEKNYYLAFDSIVGAANTGLYNGKRYIDRFRSSKENHRFFKDYAFANGYVMYNNQPYFNINLMYDLYEDILIAKLKGDKNFFNMVFISNDVKEFNIYDTHFVNILNYSNDDNTPGFAELLYESDKLVLLKKYEKDKKDKLKRQTVVHEFNLVTSYLVSNGDNLTAIKSKKDFKTIFPNKIDSIYAYYKDNKSLQENNPDLFMIKLAQLINNLN